MSVGVFRRLPRHDDDRGVVGVSRLLELLDTVLEPALYTYQYQVMLYTAYYTTYVQVHGEKGNDSDTHAYTYAYTYHEEEPQSETVSDDEYIAVLEGRKLLPIPIIRYTYIRFKT